MGEFKDSFKDRLVIVMNPYRGCVEYSEDSKDCYRKIESYCDGLLMSKNVDVFEVFCETNQNYKYMRTNKYHKSNLFTGDKFHITDACYVSSGDKKDLLTVDDIFSKMAMSNNQPAYEQIDVVGWHGDTNVFSTAISILNRFPYMRVNVLADKCIFTSNEIKKSVFDAMENLGIRVFDDGARYPYPFSPYDDCPVDPISCDSDGVNNESL